jgi:DNA polymerase-3 subunit alpha
MGKKKADVMAQQKKKFIEGAVKNGIAQKAAANIFAMIEKFAQYGFNKSHAVAYSFLAYQTGYLKAHYPIEFLTACMTNEFDDQVKVSTYLEDCRKLGIKVLKPDVNFPAVYFEVEDQKIRFGLAAIKNVGVKAVEEIKRGKQKLGRDFTSIFDFCANVDTHIVNKRSLEGLILAGAFDSVHKNRKELYLSVQKAIEFGANLQQYEKKMENSLFGGVEE